MRAVDGAGYSDQAGSVWSGVTAVTAVYARGERWRTGAATST
jgi:hypothetical protein